MQRFSVAIHGFLVLSVLFLSTLLLCAQEQSLAQPAPPKRVVFQGTVYDADSRKPIPYTTVQVVGTSLATTTNDDGEYRLIVTPGQEYQLKFTHIAYYSERTTLASGDAARPYDVYLHPSLIELRGQRVFDRAVDPAQEIILEAIARKESILNRLHDYSFEAYTKIVVRDRKKPDTTNIFLIAETQLTAFWERPDKFKEVISARRQTRNIPAEANLVRIGEILNFNKNRIEVGDQQVVSPTATDALDHYNYYLLDTTFIDSQQVFVIEIEPKSELETLFKGTISIADSTYDVVAVDVGFSGLQTPFLVNPHYSQRYAQFNNEYWLPIEIRFGANYKLPVPFPGVPSELAFMYVASLYEYSVEKGIPGGTFGEVVLEVTEKADAVDSSAWAARQTVPLTDQEEQGYERIDSVESAPKPLGKRILNGLAGLTLLATTQDQFFHFNRAEGTYLGLGTTFGNFLPHTQLYVRGGYAFDAEYWQYAIGASYRLPSDWPLTFRAEYHDEAVKRPSFLLNPELNTTIPALFYRSDPFDYYAERGVTLSATTKLLDHTRLTLGYNEFRQSTLGTNNSYSIFHKDDFLRANPDIVHGTLRSVSAGFTYDSRPMYKRKGRETFGDAQQYTQFSFRVEHASPDLFDNDFDFTRYYSSLYRRQRLSGWGVTSFNAFWGESDRYLPPQRYFNVTYIPLSIFSGRGFQTLDKNNFTGSRVLAMTARHEFGRKLFVASGLPGVRKIPFHLSLHGGAFWTDFENHPPMPGVENIRTAHAAYKELGFGLSNLTPFWAPFNLALNFTWQLSDYDTDNFSVSWGFEL